MDWDMNRLFNFTIEQGKVEVVPHKIECPFCGGDMYIHVPANVGETKGIGYKGGHHVDLRFKCSYCGFYSVFGVPISEGEYLEISGKEFWRIEELNEQPIKERLEALGYW